MSTDTPEQMDTPMLDTLFEETETDALSDSDKVYLNFRQIVDPGLMAANFDLTPGKSAAFHSRIDGEQFIDQSLRSHILNGAAFGARLNRALQALGSQAALTDNELLEVLAMYACHDLHKSEDAQRRRAGETDTEATEYDIPDAELRHYITELRLDTLDTTLEYTDFKASALRAEEGEGRHRTVSSTLFTARSDWIRLLDAAAALSEPRNVKNLKKRLADVAPDVQLDYHRIGDTKGITTNILNAAITEYTTSETDAETIVYFQNGAVYLTPTETDIHDTITSTPDAELMRDMADTYVTQLHDEVDSFADLEQIKNSLTGKWAYGYIIVGKSSYLLYGFDRTEEAIRAKVEDKSTFSNWTIYSAYKKGTISAIDNGIVDTLPDDYHKPQALAVYLGSMEEEIFRSLHYKDTISPVLNIANALELPSVVEYFEQLTANGTWEHSSPELTDSELDAVVTHLDETENNVSGIISDGYKLTSSKAWSHIIAHAFLNTTRPDGTQRSELPVADVLADMSDMLNAELNNWNSDWDDTIRGDWDSSLPADEKVTRFKKRLLGPFYQSTRDYIARFVSINGKQLATAETNKSKRDEAQKETQPHVCMLCRDLLIGGKNLKRDFKTSESVVGVPLGFTHMTGITGQGSEPTSVVCSQCDMETTLRNSIHSLDADDSHNYLFIAPDYYYSPADMAIQARIRRQLKSDSGFTLLQVANEILSGNPNARANSIERILEVFKTDGNYTDYNEFIHNYDAAISDINSTGVYHLEPPKDISGENGNSGHSARISRWLLDSMFSMVVSWATSSRVLLTPNPLPSTDFTDFPEMVKLENAPGPVTDFLGGNTISISRHRDLDQQPEKYQFRNLTVPDWTDQNTPPSAAGEWDETRDAPVETATDGGSQARLVQLLASPDHQSEPQSTGATTLTLDTEFGTTLYKLSSLLYMSQRRFGHDVSKLTTTLKKTYDPFPGASLALKGTDKLADYSALSGASVLDTLTDYAMSNTIQQLAEAGFEALHPRTGKDSNHEYERLFRVATETVMDMNAASTEELKTLVAGEVMNTATRTMENGQYINPEYTREPAEDFAEVFVDEIFERLCNGDPFNLNQKENTLASGYNAAIRRHEKAWHATQNSS